MEANEDESVIITHFINPHMFWYREVQDDNMILLDIDYKLTKYLSSANSRDNGIKRNERYTQNELVAVRYLPWGRYIRARVVHLLENISGISYILWALDYGIPLKSELKHIIRLPSIFQDIKVDLIRFGGIDKIVPAVKVYEAETKSYKIQPKSSWSQEAVETMQSVINDSANMSFTKLYKHNGEHIFGNLKITNHANEIIDAAEFLSTHNYAVKVTNLSEKLNKLQTIHFKCWEKNNKSVEFYRNHLTTNEFKFKRSFNHLDPDECDEHAFSQEKVLDWQARCEVNNFPISIEDISFDDSVSNIMTGDRQKKEAHLSKDNLTENQHFYKIGGILEKIKKQRYKDNIPPPPAEYSAEDKLSVAESSKNLIDSTLNRRRLLKTELCPANEITAASDKSHGNNMRQSTPIVEMGHTQVGSTSPDHQTKIYNKAGFIDSGIDNEGTKSTLSRRMHKLRMRYTGEVICQDNAESANKAACSTTLPQNTSIQPKPVIVVYSNVTENPATVGDSHDTAGSLINKRRLARNFITKNKDYSEILSSGEDLETKHNQLTSIKSKSINSDYSNVTENNSVATSIVESDDTAGSLINKRRLNRNFITNKDNSELISSGGDLETSVLRSRKSLTVPAGFDLNRLQPTKLHVYLEESTSTEKNNIKQRTFEDNFTLLNDIPNEEGIDNEPANFRKAGIYGVKMKNADESKQIENFHMMRKPGVKMKNTLPRKICKKPSSHTSTNASNSSLNSIKSVSSNRMLQEFQRKSFQTTNEIPIKSDFISHLVLVHGGNHIKPITSLGHTTFCNDVNQILLTRNFNKLYRIQSYTWEHLMRGRSAAIINKASTGKTMAYLPPVCSLVRDYISDNLVSDTCGPVAIILAATSSKVESIVSWCTDAFQTCHQTTKIVSSYGVRSYNHTIALLLNGCAILVSTPKSLCRLLVENIKVIDMNRLKIVVFDDIISTNGKLDDLLWKTFMKPKKNTTHIEFQTVVVSKMWQNVLKSYLKVAPDSMLCIGDYLEAAVYARTQISIELHHNNLKIHRILNFINRHPYNSEKLLIICSTDEEVQIVGEVLQSASHSCALYSKLSTADEIRSANIWKIKNDNFGNILVCTDNILSEIDVQNVQNLIHFSLSTSWTIFCNRFSVFFKYHDDYVQNNFTKSNRPCARSLILLDADNNSQLPKLVKFMEDHGQTAAVPDEVKKVSIQIRIQLEESRISENRLFCQKILEFSHCQDVCNDRHVLTKFDAAYNDIPTSGSVKFEIIKVLSVTHYCVRLLEHCNENSSDWAIIRKSDEFVKFNSEICLYFSSAENKIIQWPLHLNDICVYASGQEYLRCKIVEIPPQLQNNMMKTVHVLVKLVDSGNIIKVKSSNIWELPDKYKSYPEQSVDIRLNGIVPFDEEHVWDIKATSSVRKWLTKDIAQKDVVLGKVNFSLMSTIWVDNVIVMEKVDFLSKYVYKIDVKRSIIDSQIGMSSDVCDTRIKEMISQCGIDLFCEKSEDEAHHTTKNTSTVSSSDEYKSQFSKVRLQVAKIDDIVHESWDYLDPNSFTKIHVGAFFDPFRLYLQNINNNEKLSKFDYLYRLINKYMSNMVESIDEPFIGENCLTKYEGEFNRAKIVQLTETDGPVKVFLCDIGFSAIRNVNEIFKCPKHITEYMPYQAIRCKLTGIQPTSGSKWDEDSSDNIYNMIDKYEDLFAYPVVSDNVSNNDILKLYSFEIVLVDCSTDVDVQINKELVKNNLASYNDNTIHYLDIIVNNTFHMDSKNITQDNDANQDLEFDFEINLDEFSEAMNLPKSVKFIPPENKTVTERSEIQNEQISLLPEKIKDNRPNKPILFKETYRTPKTLWHQKQSLITIVIHAPDVVDFDLRVSDEYLFLYFELDKTNHLLDLHLYADVVAQCTSVNIVGLNIVVRILKKYAGQEWDRLTYKKMKNVNIQYDYNQIDYIAENMVECNRYKSMQTQMSTSSSAESDTDSTGSVDPNRFFDPFADEFE